MPSPAMTELLPAKKEEASAEDGRRMIRVNTSTAQEIFNQRLRTSYSDLKRVGSDDEDLQVDKDFGICDACLTFKDVSFSLLPTRSLPISLSDIQSPNSESSEKKQSKLILAPVSGHFEPGALVAIMGPSGCGKTTLLDILAGKKTAPYAGTVRINGRPRDLLFNRITAYVPQEDVMPGHLTVEEVISFHSSLKQECPSKFSRSMRHALLEKRLNVLGLSDVSQSYVGDPSSGFRGISGGQRRRLSLARGLASGAQIIFCDEPTSGLSATDAEACVRYMRLVAHKYRVMIIVTIHQPRREVGKLFDQLLLLTSRPGRVVYSGPMSELVKYLECVGVPLPARMNPTDFCMDMITPGIPGSKTEEFVEFFNANCRSVIDEVVDEQLNNQRKQPMQLLQEQRDVMMIYGSLPPLRYSKYGVTFRKQLRLVFVREATLRLRDKWSFILEMVIAVMKALFLGSAFWGIAFKLPWLQMSFFYFMLMACTIDGLKTMPRVIAQRTVMKMEVSEGLYSEWAYILSLSILTSLQALIAHSVFITILFAETGFPWALFPSMWLWSMMLYYVMESLYIMLSGIAKDATTAQILSLPFLMIFLLYNGFTVARNTVPSYLAWVIAISPVAYALEGLTLAAANVCSERRCGGEEGLYDAIIEHFDYKDQSILGISIMVGCILVFRAIHVFCLKLLNNIQR